MLLRILDDFLGHNFPLEPTQSAFDRFTGVDCNYCHLYLQLKFSDKRLRFLFNTRGRNVVKRAKNDPANKGYLYSQGRLTTRLNGSHGQVFLSAEALNLNRLVAVVGLNFLLL
jgi:hypothetical protein